jgi:hypothetical protein
MPVRKRVHLIPIISLIVLIAGQGLGGERVRVEAELTDIYFPPSEFAKDFGTYRSPLLFADGHRAKTAAEWAARRKEILQTWVRIIGPWPEPLANPKFERLESTNRENFVQQRVRVEIVAGRMTTGYLLVPVHGRDRRMPAVIIPFYEPETSIGAGKPLLDFGYQLARRGFVTLSIGSPGGDAWNPETGAARCQPLLFLAAVAANCHTALAQMKNVDPNRIGIVGHSYGGKWAMFASCFYEKFACAVWSDPGIVWDETRPNVNYWEPWYLGFDPKTKRKPGVPTPENPRTGPYKELVDTGHDLQELHALMAPRPFLVSGGSEDPPERWHALNHSIAVNQFLGFTNRVGMTNRKTHTPTPESNEQIYGFLASCLGK